MIRKAHYLTSALLCIISIPCVSEPWFAIGEAYHSKSKELVYREFHSHRSGMQQQVLYLDPDQQPLAHKALDFSNSETSPNFALNDQVNGGKTYVELKNDELQINYQTSTNSETQQATLSSRSALWIIDAGFDNFIQQHWQQLYDKEKFNFRFPIASRLSALAMNIQRKSCTKNQGSCASASNLIIGC